MAGIAAAMRRRTGPVTIDRADAWRKVDVSLPEREIARALRSLISREVLAGIQAYSFKVDLQRLWLEQHRHLDWVKDELAETVQQWNRSAEPWPADAIPGRADPCRQRKEPPTAGNPGESAGAKPRLARSRYLAIAIAGRTGPAPGGYRGRSRVPLLNDAGSNSTQGPTFRAKKPRPGYFSYCREIRSRMSMNAIAAPPPGQWSMRGLVQAMHCTNPLLPGGNNVYAYQLDSATDFQIAWRNFNQWWGFLPARAGKGCPPKGTSEGIDTSGSELPLASLPVTECGMQTPSPGKVVPAYAWGWPTSYAFVLAQAAPGSSFAVLHSWSIGQSVHRVSLQNIIPADVRGTNNCANDGTQVGATAVSQCSSIPGLAAGTIFYYLYSSPAALRNGFNAFLANVQFKQRSECASNNNFVDFIAECESAFTSSSPEMTGRIAEYANSSNQPIIVSTDEQQQVMVVMVGTNDGDLLAYWKQRKWVVTGS